MSSAVGASLVLGAAVAGAQPDVRDHRGRRAPPRDDAPTEAPPPPRAETPGAKAGFVWVAGHYEWRASKYEWVAGHWERERAGKSWREARWDRQGDKWVFVAGAWITASVTPPAQPDHPRKPPPPPRAETPGAKAGFVWVPGQYEWRTNDYEWVAGHWERERAGKKWRESRWEQRGDHYEHTPGDWIDADTAPHHPRKPPPPPRSETPGAKAGFVWTPGRYEWRTTDYEWVPGHWERERAGKRWRESRWEQRGDHYEETPGDWIDADAVTPPTTTAPPPRDGRRGRERWKHDRPTVSSYWPTKGKVGSRITIRGRNFAPDTIVMWGDRQIAGAKVTADRIVFDVAKGTASGTIALRSGRARLLPVGPFEVAAAYDPVAERRKLEAEQRKQAEAAWAERQGKLAKDRAARDAAMRERERELTDSRAQRRAERVAAIRARWEAAFLADPETQSELALHAQRLAELDRMARISERSNNGKLAVRIEIARSREDARHDQRMAALKAGFGK